MADTLDLSSYIDNDKNHHDFVEHFRLELLNYVNVLQDHYYILTQNYVKEPCYICK